MPSNRELIDEDKIDWSDKDSIIDFYTKNQLYFNNYSLLTDNESLIYVIETKIAYCSALESRHKYSFIIPILDQIDSMLPKIKESTEFDRIYENYLFNRGVTYRRLKDFKESQKYFTELLNLYPEDELYLEWYESNKSALWAKKFKILRYIGLSLTFIILIMQISHLRYSRIILYFGITSMMIGFFVEDIRKIWNKTKK